MLPGDLVRLVHLLLTFVLAFFRSIAVVLSGLVTAGIALKLLHLHAFHDGGVFAHCPSKFRKSTFTHWGSEWGHRPAQDPRLLRSDLSAFVFARSTG